MRDEESGAGTQGIIQAVICFTRRHSHINWALADQAMVSGSNFITGILLARALGIAEFGRFTLAWMVVLFVQSIQHAAINAPMMSIGPKQEVEDCPAYFGSVFVQQILFAALSAALIFAGVSISVAFFPDWGIAPLVLPLTAVVFFSQIQDFLRRYFFTIGAPVKSFISDFIRYFGQISLLFMLLFSAQIVFTSTMVLWVLVGTSVLAILIVPIKLPDLSWSAQSWRAVLSHHWHFSKWLIGSATMQWTTGNLFILVAGIVLGSVAVGALKAAQNILGITHILFLGLENVFPIQAAKIYASQGMAAFKKYMFTFLAVVVGMTAVFVAVLALAPDFWMGMLYGYSFSQYGFVLQVYGVIYILFGFGIMLAVGLRVLEHVKPIFTSKLLSTVFAITFSYPLIYFLELKGVLFGLLLSQLIERFWLAVAFHRFASIPLPSLLTKPHKEQDAQ